ncbi:MAG: S-layer homology domain-containing protein [Evtepia sp.]|nr:S-layer homology domain-containing protein [Evtepia sp.]
MKKRIIASILTVIMLMTMLPTAALAAASPGTSSGTVIYVSESGDDSAAGDENAPLKTIGAAFTKATDGDTICLLSDIKLVGKLVLTGDRSVTLAGKADETAKKITYTKDTSTTSTEPYMIEVGVEYGTATKTKLTLENVTIDAEAQDIRCVRVCPESTLTLENKATVCNGRAVHEDYATGTNDWGGGIVVDSTAKLIMNEGSAVTDCSAEQGGGIYLSGEMELNGGMLSGNTAVGDHFGTSLSRSAHGGAILIRANRADYDESYDVPAKLTMTGGNIQNNKAASDLSAFGGAVAILGTPKNTVDLTNEFIMTGGTISGNAAGYGDAISVYAADRYWNGNASVKISGNAEITQNIGRNGGGAIALWTSKADDYTSTVEMSGGTISENKTFSKGGGVFLYGKGDSFYMTDGKISDNEAKQGGGISISDTDAAAYLLGGTIQDNKATDGYPHYDDASERSYYGNAVYQDGSLYLDGTKANISGDIRIGCRFDTSGGISTNRFVALVGASDTMNDYELTSFESESLDGRVVVAPDTITYGTETYSVADAEPYLAHFTHNHKEIITDTDYTAETGASSQAKSLVLYGVIQKYSVTYTDGIGGTSFADELTSNLRRGTPTPAFTGGTPTRSGYTFTGWEPSVAATVTDNAVYTAQWAKNSSSSHHSTRYTLHYESNGGTAYRDERYTSGTKVTLDKIPTRESYTFTGWYTDEELTNKITSVTMTSDKTVYAGWVATGVPDMLNGDDHDAYVIGYPDGNVHPQGNISRAETATIFFRLLKADTRDGNLTAENAFADVVDGQWFNKAVSTMAKLGIVKGRSAESFAPDAPITRAEFAAICARFNTKPTNTSNSFSDISGHWAEAEIERAVAFSWIAGYPDGTFRPDTYITRAEAMTMINRVLCRMPQDEKDLLRTMVVWPDNKPTDWYYLAVQEATNSHEFERKGAVNETWTKLTSAPDWTRYQ